MQSSNKDPRAIRAAKAFPERLKEVHQGRIVLQPDAVYHGVNKHISVVCMVCGYEWGAQPNHLVHNGHGCPKCAAKKCTDNAGKTRAPRASEAERNRAIEMRVSGMSYRAIAGQLGRSKNTIALWCDPKQYKRHRSYDRKYYLDNRERRIASITRYQTEFEHGKAVRGRARANRRKRKRGEQEWNDEIMGVVNLLHVPSTGSDLTKEQQVYIECDRRTKETGVEHHVHHIWPLAQGGPHVWYNLTVITAKENISKGASYPPEDQALYAARVAQLFLEDEACDS